MRCPSVKSRARLGLVISTGREAEFRRVLCAVQEWASTEPDVRGVAVVGSWARGTAGMESDVDIVVLTDQLDRHVNDRTWVGKNFDGAEVMRTEAWGTLTELRLRLPSGLEVELGFAPRSWAATDPIDPGTARVIRDGCRPLLDPDTLFAAVIAAAG